jgi:hypothetical protein
VFFIVKKDEFKALLDRFPEQKSFIKAVGRQRIQTTKPEDLLDEEDGVKNLLENQSLLNHIDDKEILFSEEGKFSKLKSIANLSMQIRNYRSGKNKKLPCNVTKQFPILDQFIIIPFSTMFYIWGALILMACAYTLFIVPF